MNAINYTKNFSETKTVLKIEFESIVTYDDWIIFEYKNNFYACDNDGIFKVNLKYKVPSNAYDENDSFYYECDYNGESDDLQYYLGFNIA